MPWPVRMCENMVRTFHPLHGPPGILKSSNQFPAVHIVYSTHSLVIGQWLPGKRLFGEGHCPLLCRLIRVIFPPCCRSRTAIADLMLSSLIWL